ncbi:MAG: PAS domain S-box protein [Bacteroidales bacterium]|nr:PAS domain S-box protein [Bacteroidales bacterium]
MMKILLIDDLEDNLIALNAIINDEFPEANVIRALDGASGIELAKIHNPDIILLDILMPGIDGFEVCQILKEGDITRDIPVVFVTALIENRENKIKALQVGAEGFLTKPIDETELVAQINAMLKIKAANVKLKADKEMLEQIVFERTSELKESEEKYRALYENAPLSYQSLNEDGSFKDVNPAWLNTLGYKREEVIGKFYIDFLHPDYKAHFEKNFPAFKKRGYVHDVQFEIRHKEGHYIYISFEGCIGYHPDGSFRQTYCVFQDITERKQAEEKLKDSEERFKVVTESAEEWVWEVDAEGLYTYSSNVVEKILGYKAEEIVGKKYFYDFFPDDVRTQLKDEAFKVFHQKQVFKDFENANVHKNGQTVILKTSGSPILDEQGDLKGYRGVDSNVTEAILAENELVKNQFYLNKAQEIGVIGTWELDIQKNILKWTDENYKIFGVPLGTKMTYEIFLNCIHPEDRDYVIEKWNEALANKPYDIEHRVVTNGKVKWVREKADIEFDSAGNAIIGVGVTQDITERKQKGEAQRIILEIAKSNIVSLEDLFHLVRKELNYLVDTSNFILAFYNESTETLKKVIFEDEHDTFDEWSIYGTLSGEVIRQNKSIHLKGEEIIAFIEENNFNKFGTIPESWLGIPLLENKKIMGVLVMQSYSNKNAFDSKVGLIEMVVRELSLYIEKRNFIQSLELAKKETEEKNRVLLKQQIEIESNNKNLESLLNIARLEVGSIPELLDNALKESIHLTKSKIGYIFLYNDQDGQLTLHAWSEQAMQQCKVNNIKLVYDLDKTGCWGEAIRQNGPFMLNDYSAESNYKKGTPNGHVQLLKFLTIPVYINKRIVAVIGVANKETDYNETDIARLNLLADSVWKIVERIEYQTQLKNAKTAAEQSQKLYQGLFDNATIGLYQTTPEGKILLANPTLVKMLKFNSLDELLERDLTNGSYLDIKKRETFKSILSEKGTVTNFEAEWITNMGEVIFVNEGARAYFDENNEIVRYDGVVEDITEKKNLITDLITAKEKAQESDRLKSAFLANMSHEIRTPMNGILGFSSLLKEKGLTGEEQEAYIEIIEKSGERMLNTINDIIDISKIDSNLMLVSIQEVNITEQIADLFKFFKPQCSKKGLIFKMESSIRSDSFLVKTDNIKFNSILTNLIKNAIKYTDEGEISMGYLIKEKYLEFYVKDTGIGISAH